MTLYRHAPDKAALRVAEIMLEQLKVDSADPDWAPYSGLSRATSGGWRVTTRR